MIGIKNSKYEVKGTGRFKKQLKQAVIVNCLINKC